MGQSVAGIARPLDRRGDHQPPAEQRIGEFEVEFVRSQVQGEAGDYAALLKLRAMLRTKSASATGEARLHYELLLRNIEKALKK